MMSVKAARIAACAFAAALACARDLSIPIPQHGTLKGRVTVAGQPRAGAQLRLLRTSAVTVTAQDGTWILRRVPIGTYSIFASVDANGDGVFKLSRTSTAELLSGGEDVVVPDLELQPSGSVAGRITAAGAARPGAMVFVPGTRFSAFADAGGKYLLAGVPPGAVQIGASAPGYLPQVIDVSLAPGEAKASVDFALAAIAGQRASFRGTVRFTDRPQAPALARVQAFLDGTLAADVETVNGAYAIGPLAAGVYTLRFDADAHRTLVVPLVPLAGEDRPLDEVWLEPGTPLDPGTPSDNPDGGPPAALTSPRALVAAPGDGRITLSWDAPEAGADGYVVYRTDGGPPPAPLATTPDRAYVDSTVANYQRWHYRVTAKLRGQESPLDQAPAASATPGPGTVLSGASGTRTLDPAGNPHVIVGDDLLVLAGQTLTIKPGVELRFDAGRKMVVQGTLLARGTQAQPILLTRFGTSGWAGLVFEDTSTDAALDANGEYVSGTILERAIVEKASATGITVNGSSPLLLQVEVRQNNATDSASKGYGGGLRIGPGAGPVVRGCSIHHNAAGTLDPDVYSAQWGAGVYSEGNPVLRENEISFNVLIASSAANSDSHGAGVYLKAGRATLSRNRFAANDIAGSGQANTAEVMRGRGLALYVADGNHVIANNVFENHQRNQVDTDLCGTIYFETGTHLFAHNRVANNLLGNRPRGAAICIDAASVEAYLNQFASNTATNGTTGAVQGSALYAEDTRSAFRFNDFTGNSTAPAAQFEIYNTSNLQLDLRSNHFSAGGSVSIYRPQYADASDARATPFAAAGPKACAADADCAALGGAQRCLHAGCMPVCLLDGCAVGKSCDPSSGACN